MKSTPKNLLVYLVSFSLVVMNSVLVPLTAAAEGEPEPTVITTCFQLQAINNDLTGNYVLGNDIDCSAETTVGGVLYNGGLGFDPIGDANPANQHFTGTFDGVGYNIDGLYMNRPGQDWVSLFALVEGSVGNFTMTNVDITGAAATAAVTSRLDTGATMSEVSVEGSITGTGQVGGVTAINFGTMSNVASYGTVRGTVYNTGGLVGANSEVIADSYSRADIIGADTAGGLVGDNSNGGVITRSYSTGSVTGDTDLGGLVGKNEECDFEGMCDDFPELLSTGTVSDSFYDTETSGQNDDTNKGTPKSTANMKNVATFTDEATLGLDAAWDFVGNPNNDIANNDYWDIDGATNDGYAFLAWQEFPDVTPPDAPTEFTATATGNDIDLSWTNPVADFASVTIRRSVTAFPENITDGTLVVADSVATTYTDENLEDGTYYYSIFAKDASDNVSAAATASDTVDTVVPTVEIEANDTTLTVEEALTTSSNPIVYVITFSEDVTGFEDEDLIVTNGTAGELVAVSASVYQVEVTPDALGDEDEIPVSLGMNEGMADDLAGNPSATRSPLVVVYDPTAPTAVLTYEPDTGFYKEGDEITITATFDEEIADDPVMQIAISGANTLAAADMTKVDITTYTFEYTVGAGDGAATVALSTGTDVADNVITEEPVSGGSFQVDNTAIGGEFISPDVESGGSTTETTLPFAVTFDEDAADNFAVDMITVVNGTIENFAVATINTQFSFDVIPSGAGEVSVSIPAATFTDVAGNDNEEIPEYSFTYAPASSGSGGGGGGSSSGGSSGRSTTKTSDSSTKSNTSSGSGEDSFPLKDVDSHFSLDYVKKLYVMKVIQGKTATEYKPDDFLTRAELAKIAVLLFNYPLSEDLTVLDQFSDVDKDEWYGQLLASAVEAGFMDGYGDDTMRPNQYVTRAEALKILLFAAKRNNLQAPEQAPFIDVLIIDWFKPLVDYAYWVDIINGQTATLFGPYDYMTRGEMAIVAGKTYELDAAK